MANTVERILGWIAAAALVLAAAALAITYVPGVRPWVDGIVASVPHVTPKPSIDDAQDALDKGDAVAANRIATQVVAADPTDASVDNRAGNIALRAGDEKTAEHDYQLGEAADDKNPWNFLALGEAYARQGKYPQADTQLRAALSIAPDTQFLHYDLGVVELREQLAQSALSDFEAELKRSPGYGPALEGRADALDALGRSLDARAARMIALAKLPASPSPKPSPLPKPSPSSSPGSSPSPSPSAAASPTAKPARPNATPSGLPFAALALPTPSSKANSAPKPKAARIAAAQVGTAPAPTLTISPSPLGRLPRSIADLASEAKGYLFDVARDPGFTRALPFADPTQPMAAMQSAIEKGSIDDVLSAGTAAMLTHHFALAQSAFASATEKARNDWRGPFLAGLNAQQRGDQAAARTFFTQAASRGGPAAVYVSLAVADVAEGADVEALDSAQRAEQMAPGFAPAPFTAGMIEILMADVPSALHDLDAALAAGGAPDRTSYFLSTLREREEISP